MAEPLPARPTFREYRRVARKSLDNWWIFRVERSQSMPLSFLLYRWAPWVRPNHVTVSAAVLGLTSLAVLALRLPFYWVALVGLQFWRIMDGIDGELARTKRLSSMLGEYLDSGFDTLLWPLCFAGLALHYHPVDHRLTYLAAAILLALYMTRLAVLVRSHNLWKRGIAIVDLGGRPTDELERIKGEGGSLVTRAGFRLLRLYAHYIQGYVILNWTTLALLVDLANDRAGWVDLPLGGAIMLLYYAPILVMPPAVMFGLAQRIRAMDRERQARAPARAP